MHFDDRLATVLRLPTGGNAMTRIQFRQLIDLLGRAESKFENGATLDAAFARMDELATLIPASERAAILGEPMMRLSNPELVAHLSAAEPAVASAAITAADLAEAEWLDLIPMLPVRARGILRHRDGFGSRVEALLQRLGIADRGLPPVISSAPTGQPARPTRPELFVVEGGAAALKPVPVSSAAPLPPPAPAPGDLGIGAIVQRIEAFRQARISLQDTGDATQFPHDAAGTLARTAILAFDFTTDGDGRVDFAEGPLAPGLVGIQLAGAAGDRGGDRAGERLRQAMRHRQPLCEAGLALPGAPALAGLWQLDALPLFDGPDGRFMGYAGRLRRMSPAADAAGTPPSDDADTMRQVLHELRTPANAIQIAAEIIQQQLYGPAPHEYRALAAAIAGDTAQVLAGFDELDRLVKLESGVLAPEAGACDLGAVVTDTVARLRSWTDPRGSGFALAEPVPPLAVALDREEAARLVWRLLAALAGATAAGETLLLSLDGAKGQVVLTIALPQSLADRLDEARSSGQPFEPARSLSAGMFGIGFTLRLATAEAEAAGGLLEREDAILRLTLAGLTLPAASHTQA